MRFINKLLGDTDREAKIRTVDSVISILLQVTTLAVQIYGLHYIMTHPH